MSLIRFGEKAKMRSALLHIGGFGCETYTRGHCEQAGRTRGAEFTADAWCDACVANDALGRPKGRESYLSPRALPVAASVLGSGEHSE